MSELLDHEMTGVQTETKWLDKLAWFFIVWAAAYLTANFILPVEPSLVQFPDTRFPESFESSESWLQRVSAVVLQNREKILASYLVLNLLIMLLSYGLLHRLKYVRGPFVFTMYLTILFHFLKWTVMVVYLKTHGVDTIPANEDLASIARLAKLLMYGYVAYIVLLWFGFRWISKRLRSDELSHEFDEQDREDEQP